MAILQAVISLVILGLLYSRMIRREAPLPITKAQALVPVLLGVVSLTLSFAFVLINTTVLIKGVGIDSSGFSPMIHSLYAAFFAAGLPEEIAKLLMILLTLRIFRSRIKNVYEYVLVGAAVGLGFTLFEEFLYGSGAIVLTALRLLTIAAHMIFGMIMGRHLGLARYNKLHGGGSAGEIARAILLPVLIHTVYDALTANNYLLRSEDEALQMIGIVLSIVAAVVLFIVQIRVLTVFKKDAEKLCGKQL